MKFIDTGSADGTVTFRENQVVSDVVGSFFYIVSESLENDTQIVTKFIAPE